MKTKMRRVSRRTMSVILSVVLLLTCFSVGLIASDAAEVKTESAGANVDTKSVGYSNGGYVKGTWDNWATPDDGKGHNITSGYTVSLSANTTYEFCFVAIDNNDIFKKNGVTITASTNGYDFDKTATENAKIKTTVAGEYKFQFSAWNGDDHMRVNITFPSAPADPDTWTVVGGITTDDNTSDPIFGTTWTPTLTENDMTESSGTYTWSKSNVTLESASTIYYKVAKNHAWDTTVPSGANKTTVTLDNVSRDTSTNKVPAGTYNVSVTFDGTNAPVLSLTTVAKSTLTVASTIANTTAVTATYNGTTVGKGESIANIPQGAAVTINVTPSTGYKCTGVTSTPSTTITGAINSYTLIMPGEATEVSATTSAVTMKKIFFNNNYTQYGTVYAYVYNKSGETHTYEYLGKEPGKVMNETDNTEIWYIEVPQDVTYVEFKGFKNGVYKSTGELKIPWVGSGETNTYTYPKYTAPYTTNDPTTDNGGTWDNYIWGDDMGDARDNVYTVSKGSTMNASNLFTGITATLYDYYTDGEITANAGTASDTGLTGAPNGWIKGINSNEYTWKDDGWKWIPNTKLNGALIGYADDTHQPNYEITYPLYFGNLNYNADASEVSGYYNYIKNVNNSTGLTNSNNAVTGLTGKTLGDDNTIHYFSASDTTNENGAPMAMFNEDFLSGENSEKKPLATILRTSSFPVRKEEHVGGTTTYEYYDDRIYYTTSGHWNDANAWTALYYWNNDGNGWVASQTDSNGTYFTIPSGTTGVQFVRLKPSTDAGYNSSNNGMNWYNKWNQIPDSGTAFPVNSTNIGKTFNITSTSAGSLSSDKIVKSSTTTGGHTYYEFDSTNGKDNAYIQSIDKSNKTAKINYYNNTNKVHSNSNTDGFFPFNRSGLVPNTASEDYAQDLGFGMKLVIPFTLEGSGDDNGVNTDGTDQTFDFSGDDDLWVFVDGKLVLDLGGAHARTTGSINFHDKTVTANNTQAIDDDYSRNGSFATGFNTNENYVHTMTIYYMERGMFDSNLKFGFSFHAIPNQFWIDKKIRTKDKYGLGKDTLNGGLFASNGLTGDDSNITTHTVGDKTTSMSKFEKSYQDEQFTVTHQYSTDNGTTYLDATGKNYTIDYNDQTQTVGSGGQYPIYHDKGNAFIGQFTTGNKFKLKETISSSNKYVYDPVFTVWDQANNDATITPTDNGDGTYTFDFSPTVAPAAGGIENTNIKARFDNYIVAHDLTLTKRITNATDTSTDFTFQIKFDFTGTTQSPNYVSYPLYYDLDGERKQMGGDGKVTAKAGQVIKIIDIPEKAKIQVTEVLTDTVSGYRYAGATLTKGNEAVTPTNVTKGIQFVMGNNDMSATFSNKKPDNKYTITYKYPSYGASPKTSSLYGEQSYTVTGVFTKDELNTYMSLDGSGNLQFRSPDLKKTFVNNKAPYEDNFMQTLSFADSDIVETDTGWDGNGDYSCSVTANGTENYNINVYFDLPYAVDSDATLVPKETSSGSGIVAKIENSTHGSKKITCFDWYVTAGDTHNTDGWTASSSTFVKAPLILYDDTNKNGTIGDEGDTPYYFQYWNVKSQSGYGKQSTGYTRCYDYEFNFALFMDSVIEPVYATTWAQTSGNPNPPSTYNNYKRFDPEIQVTGTADENISIAFLENSRNQFNNSGGGERSGAAADTIYSDFLLSFNYNATNRLQQLNQLDSNTKKAGLVVEAVDTMDYEEGSTIFDYDKNYSSVSKFNSNEETQKATIVAWLEKNDNSKLTGVNKRQFDVTALDNKNCIQYYASIKNRNLGDNSVLLNTNQNRYKVFRAYAYIGDVSGATLTKVKLSQPVYFTIYDVGANGLVDNFIA